MKKLLLITCYLFYCISFSAQDYIPFPDSEATWNSSSLEFSEPDGVTTVEYERGINFHMTGDTIINDTLYSLLYYRRSWYSGHVSGPNPSSLDTSYSQLDYPYILIGGLREDDNKKVWYRNLNFDNWNSNSTPFPWYEHVINGEQIASIISESSEIMLYDFGIQVGDSIMFEESSFLSEGYWTILEDISVDILGRKTYTFPPFDSGENRVWVEGIGDISSTPFSRFDCNDCEGLGFGIYKELNCFWQNGEQIYSSIDNVTADCEGLIFVGIDELEKKNLEIYPNPSEGRFIIKLPSLRLRSGTCVLSVFDSLGEEVYSEMNVIEDRFEIDLDAYPSGMYMVRVTVGGSKTGTSTGSGTYTAKVVKK